MTKRMMNLVVKAINEAGIAAELITVQKNNEAVTGVAMGDGKIRACLYFVDAYHGNMTSKQIAEDFIKRYESISETPEIDPDKIMTREYIKEHVHMKIVPYSEYVKGKASKNFLDLYKLFFIDTPVDDGFVTLTINHIEKLGIEVDELEAWADKRYEVRGMYETMIELDPDMAEIIPKPEHEEQLVLSNDNKFYGATAITSKAVLDLACDKLGAETIYILPSSIHECLAVSMGDPDELRQMVCEVNNTKLKPQERLSYNVYKYERDGELEIA